ncbi:Uncharacterised protein [Cedecea neteri]|uniref:DMT superfamily transporter inner membrane protein n=1 Tax=Cedecea neteri TaxID=158822 RepID=A0A2X3J0Z4_9ENTR|nr:Uncharacterised protein [Cedecea neteri]
MNALLYILVVVIWGTTWIAIYMQQGVVSVPVSIFLALCRGGGG